METDSAAFINMLMERLQTLEAANQRLQDTVLQFEEDLHDALIANEQLELRVAALESSLHLVHESEKFNDGFTLCLGFPLQPDWLEHPLDSDRYPLDALHYSATSSQCDPNACCSSF